MDNQTPVECWVTIFHAETTSLPTIEPMVSFEWDKRYWAAAGYNTEIIHFQRELNPIESKAEAPKVGMTCNWQEDDDGNWNTRCGQSFVLNDGYPVENDIKFCCYCGGALEETRYQEPPEVPPGVEGKG